jgi:hypothetical protein
LSPCLIKEERKEKKKNGRKEGEKEGRKERKRRKQSKEKKQKEKKWEMLPVGGALEVHMVTHSRERETASDKEIHDSWQWQMD